MKIHNFEQKSDEWFAIRKGKMSASHAQAIATCGKGLDTYIGNLVSEYHSSGERDFFTNKDMERGNELEEFAREMYELETGSKVKEVGFVEHDEYSGCSPDGLVDEDGLLEVKALNDAKHFQMLLTGKIDSGHIWQMQMQILVCKRKWCDFVAYNPNFKKTLIIIRVLPDYTKQASLLAGIEKGSLMIKSMNDQYNKIIK